MTEKLEKLIELAVTDGVITERELEILKKKAKEEGVDEDELEMLLDTRLYERNEALKEEIKNSIPPPPINKPKSNKEGNIKKCPSCGASVESFNIKCSECGHEFRNTDATNCVKELENKLSKIKFKEEEQEKSKKKISNIIKSHPIPNNKEDLFEMLTYMSGKVLSSNYDEVGGDEITNAYYSRAIEVANKIKFTSGTEKNIIARVNDLESEMKRYRKSKDIKQITGMIFAFGFGLPIMYIMYSFIAKLFGYNFWPFN